MKNRKFKTILCIIAYSLISVLFLSFPIIKLIVKFGISNLHG